MSIGIGSTIKKVRYMTDHEMEKEGWEHGINHGNGVVLEMSDGGKIYASRDEAGNGPGVFFGESADGESVYIRPEQPTQAG